MDEPLLRFPVCATIIYVPLMIFGLLGNVLTILVVWLRPYMRSSTYLYLSSLAVSDILILLLLPVDLYKVHAGRLCDRRTQILMWADVDRLARSLMQLTQRWRVQCDLTVLVNKSILSEPEGIPSHQIRFTCITRQRVLE